MTKTELMQLSPAELADMVMAKQGEVDALAAHVERANSLFNSVLGELNEASNRGFTHGNCRERIVKFLDQSPTASLAEHDKRENAYRKFGYYWS